MRPLSHALPGALAALLSETPMSDGKVDFAWRAAVGSVVGRATAVKLEGGTLIVETNSHEWAREIRRSAGTILPRLQTLLGREAIARIDVRAIVRNLQSEINLKSEL